MNFLLCLCTFLVKILINIRKKTHLLASNVQLQSMSGSAAKLTFRNREHTQKTIML